MEVKGALRNVLAVVILVQMARAVRMFNDLRVRTNAFDKNSPSFFELPKKLSSSLIKNYVRVQPEPGYKFKVDFYCYPNDPRFCVMFDKKGWLAGVQISFLKSDVANVSTEDFDYSATKNYKKTNFFNIPAYSMRVYFTNPLKLTTAGRQNLNEVAEGLWTYLDGRLVEIPRTQPSGDKFGDFYKQGCNKAEGQLYVYKYHRESPCNSHYTLFPLYEQGGLVGFGMASPGTPSKGPTRNWYEKPTPQVMQAIVPKAPMCSFEIHQKYGYISIHVFLVDNPQDISCSK